MADEFRQRALQNGQLGAGITAVKEIRVLTGKRIERSEIGAPGQFDSLTDDELDRLIVERFVRLGFARKLAISDGSIALNGVDKDNTEGP
jgi:hypothetical protein